ncbi:MAG TPA: hypothetical protein VG738_19565 [Chitinophagaceae bacterium]|nr:hypothetical protein [Chitinophagaceae bacterium]
MEFEFANHSGEDINIVFYLFDQSGTRRGSPDDGHTIADTSGDGPEFIIVDLSRWQISPGVYPYVQIYNLGDGMISYELN